MRAYLQLTGTILLSLVGGLMLKLSDGFANPAPTAIFAVCEILAFFFFSLALRTIPLSVGYAIWSGFSTAGNALVGHFYFHESLGGLKIAVLAIVIIGIVLINHARLPVDEADYYNRMHRIIR